MSGPIWEWSTDNVNWTPVSEESTVPVPPGAMCRMRPPDIIPYDDFKGLSEMAGETARLLDNNNINAMFSPLCGVPKNPPYWVSHTKRLFYRDRVVADLRFSAATPERVEFMVKALNDAEEKR